MEKELYLLFGTALGALVTLLTTMINTRSQRKIAQNTHEHQYRLEAQKLEYQQWKEHAEFIRQRIEEAYQILSKIGMESSMTGQVITEEVGITVEEYHAHYLKRDEELCRVQMIAELYVPDLLGIIGKLRGEMNVLWGSNKHHIFDKNKSEESKRDPASDYWIKRVFDASEKISSQVGAAKARLGQVATSLWSGSD